MMRLRWYGYVGLFLGVICSYLLHGLAISETALENGDQRSLYTILNGLTPSEAILTGPADPTPRSYLVEGMFFIGLPALIVSETVLWWWKWRGAE